MFDLLHVNGRSLRERPYVDRRQALETPFQREGLAAPWTLRPLRGDADVAREWLGWSVAGVEGCVFKDGGESYRPGARSWRKFAQVTAEAVIGGVTGPVTAPATLLLGRYDPSGDLRLVARTTPLSSAVRLDIAGRLALAGPGHPWHGRSFSAGWGTRGDLVYHPVRPDHVAEFIADTAVDSGRYRHPVRFVRVRADLRPDICAHTRRRFPDIKPLQHRVPHLNCSARRELCKLS